MTSLTHCCSQEMSLKGQKTVNYSFANEATLYVVLSNVKRLQNLLFNTRGHCVLLHLLCKTPAVSSENKDCSFKTPRSDLALFAAI